MKDNDPYWMVCSFLGRNKISLDGSERKVNGGCPINCHLGFKSGTLIPVLWLPPASWESFDKTLQLSGFSLLSFKMDPIRPSSPDRCED